MKGTNVQYANFFKRVSAAFLDLLVCIFLNTICIISIIKIYSIISLDFDVNSTKDFTFMFITMIISTLITLISYFSVMESSKYKGGIGKIIMGISVLNDSGLKLNFTKSLGRAFLKILTIGLILTYITILFTKKNKTYYDFLLGTCVVEK